MEKIKLEDVQIDEEFEYEGITLVCKEITQEMIDDYYRDTYRNDICKKCNFFASKNENCDMCCVPYSRPDKKNVYFPIKQ